MTIPILMLGAGRMGGAILEGWRRADAFPAADIMILDPQPGDAALAAQAAGARINPPDADILEAKTVILAVKPQVWQAAAEQYAQRLAFDAVVVSIAAGVRSADIARAFGGRTVARA